MSVAAAHADAFYREALRNREVWSVRDSGGFPAPFNGSGLRAHPFWSLESRALTIIQTVAAYRDMVAVSVDLDEWRARWLPGLEQDGLVVGLNWSGKNATGYDLSPGDVERNLSARENLRQDSD